MTPGESESRVQSLLESDPAVDTRTWKWGHAWPPAIIALMDAPRRKVFAGAAFLLVLILVLDLFVQEDASIGVIFLIPIMMASLHLGPWQVMVAALLCTLARESVAPFAWDAHFVPRIVSVFMTFVAGGLFASEVARNRRLVLRHLREIEEQMQRRREAEAQLLGLVESSPAAIVTINSQGRIDLANQAAHSLLSVEPDSLRGQDIGQFLPMLSDVLLNARADAPMRTATNCQGRRSTGENFLAYVWFAVYPARTGPRMAAIFTDSSEELRDWQQTSLETLLRSTRVLVGSVSHEIRNICAAITVAYTNLGRLPGVASTEDYEALGALTSTLGRLANFELQTSADVELGSFSVEQLLDEFRIVVDPMLEAAGVTLNIARSGPLPLVDGDRHGMLQVLLNLTRNSLRALRDRPDGHIELHAAAGDGWVTLRFQDNGPGVASPGNLFQPFQSGAKAVGLGLFISRAIVRGNGGELYHEASSGGCTMCIRLRRSDTTEMMDHDESELHV